MRLFRRSLLLWLLLLWQGGFLFYTAVVVPIGTDVLGSPLVQGLITRRVTDWLKLFGAAWAGPVAGVGRVRRPARGAGLAARRPGGADRPGGGEAPRPAGVPRPPHRVPV